MYYKFQIGDSKRDKAYKRLRIIRKKKKTFNENQNFITPQLDPIPKIWHMRLLTHILEEAYLAF